MIVCVFVWIVIKPFKYGTVHQYGKQRTVIIKRANDHPCPPSSYWPTTTINRPLSHKFSPLPTRKHQGTFTSICTVDDKDEHKHDGDDQTVSFMNERTNEWVLEV
jgi:hypothetical protein